MGEKWAETVLHVLRKTQAGKRRDQEVPADEVDKQRMLADERIKLIDSIRPVCPIGERKINDGLAVRSPGRYFLKGVLFPFLPRGRARCVSSLESIPGILSGLPHLNSPDNKQST